MTKEVREWKVRAKLKIVWHMIGMARERPTATRANALAENLFIAVISPYRFLYKPRRIAENYFHMSPSHRNVNQIGHGDFWKTNFSIRAECRKFDFESIEYFHSSVLQRCLYE